MRIKMHEHNAQLFHMSKFFLYLWDPIYKISYDLSQDYLKFIVRSTYDSDLQRA